MMKKFNFYFAGVFVMIWFGAWCTANAHGAYSYAAYFSGLGFFMLGMNKFIED